MSIEPITMSIALSDNERTRPVYEGRFQPQGINLLPTVVHPSEMFWRQLKFAEFDVSEMSISSLCIATAKGDDWTYPAAARSPPKAPSAGAPPAA
ncbi:MAG: hypothetical protein NWT00_08695, partial [Beijerinckiaceae bacterium]|nr:hypothetical protein [Beijerinckiaceae bacterium]